MEEIVITISEDLGFKALGSKVILPAFANEQLPLASLNDFQINNELNLFVATCGGETHQIIFGNLQELRDFIISQEQDSLPSSFNHIDDIQDDILSISILPNIENIVIITVHGKLIYVDIKDAKSRQLKQVNENITIQKCLIINNVLYYIDLTNSLCCFNLNQDTNQLLISENVSDFDRIMNTDKIVVLTKNDNKVQFYTINDSNLTLDTEFTHPDEIITTIEDEDECVPLNVTTLFTNQFLLVFGNIPNEDDTDIMYDHKTYIMKLDSADQPSYHETFDIAPAFDVLKRFPSIYNITLPRLVDGIVNFNIVTSSCSTELSIWDSNEVVQPDQDSERAVLPISKETDNDTSPIGIALDYSTNGTIVEPCSGVEKIDSLPLIYVLNNEGLLQVWGFYHSHAIKQNAYHVDNVASFYSHCADVAPPGQADVSSIDTSKSAQSSVFTKDNNDQATVVTTHKDNMPKESREDDVSSSLGGLSFGKPKTEANELTSGTIASTFGLSSSSPFQLPENKTSTTPVFGQGAFGSASFGQPASSSSSPFGQSSLNQANTEATSTFGKPSFGQPAFGQNNVETTSAFGKPSFGQTAFDQSNVGTTSAFGKPSFGQSPFGQNHAETASTFGKSAFGTTSSEQPESISTAPTFGQSTFGNATFGQSSGATTTSAFGTPAFGKQSFGQKQEFPVGPSFGQPTFGHKPLSEAGNSESEISTDIKTSAFGQASAFGSSPFANVSKNESPFANISKGESPFANLSTTESPFKNLNKSEQDMENSFREDEKASGGNTDKEEEDINESTEAEENLSDSTVEQTPFIASNKKNSGFSLSSFTDSLKKTANISTSNMADTTFGNMNKDAAEKSASPFASFANNLDKAQAPSFSLSNLSIDKGEKKAGQNASPEDTQSHVVGEKEQDIGYENDDKSVHETVTSGKPLQGKMDGKEAREQEFEKATDESQEIANILSENEQENAESSDLEKFEPVESQSEQENEEQEEIVSSEIEEPELVDEQISKASEELPEENSEGMESEAEHKDLVLQEAGEQEVKNSAVEVESEREQIEQPQEPIILDKNVESETEQVEESPETLTSENDVEINGVKEAGDEENLVAPASAAYESTDEKELEREEEEEEEEEEQSANEETQQETDVKAERVSPMKEYEDHVMEVIPGVSDDGVQNVEPVPLESVDAAVDATVKSSDMDVQTETVDHRDSSVQVRESRDQSCQTDAIQYETFQIQSFEEDENYLAELYKPAPLGKYYTNAHILNISYASTDPTMKLFESTYQQIEAEFKVLDGNMRMIKQFLEDQTTICLDSRSEQSVGNKYTWRIPEVTRLFDIIRKRQEEVDNFTKRLDELNKQVLKFENDDIVSILDEERKIKEQYSQLDYLQTETLNNQFAPLKYHQNTLRKDLREKMARLDKQSEEVEQFLMISKTFINYLKNPNTTNIDLLLMVAKTYKIASKLPQSTFSFDRMPHISKEKVQSLDVVQVGLKINAKKQAGEFFKQINSKRF